MSILATINTYWAIIAFAIVLIGYGVFYTLLTYWKVSNPAVKLTEEQVLEIRADNQAKVIQGLETHLASIDTSLKFLVDAYKQGK